MFAFKAPGAAEPRGDTQQPTTTKARVGEIRLTATVNERGRLVPDASSMWAASIREFAGKRVVVTIETEKTRRSSSQNAYWWAVVVPFFQEIWSRARRGPHNLPPYTKDQVHEVLVEALAGFEDGPLPGTRVRVSTSGMDSATFARLVDRARELAMHDYQSSLPAPGEQYEVMA